MRMIATSTRSRSGPRTALWSTAWCTLANNLEKAREIFAKAIKHRDQRSECHVKKAQTNRKEKEEVEAQVEARERARNPGADGESFR